MPKNSWLWWYVAVGVYFLNQLQINILWERVENTKKMLFLLFSTVLCVQIGVPVIAPVLIIMSSIIIVVVRDIPTKL